MSNEMTRKRFHNTRKFLCLLWDPYTCMTQIYGLIRKTASHKRRSRQLLVPAFFLNGMLGFHCSLGLRKRKKRLSLLRVSKRSYEIRLWINTIDPFCQLSLSVEALCHAFCQSAVPVTSDLSRLLSKVDSNASFFCSQTGRTEAIFIIALSTFYDWH